MTSSHLVSIASIPESPVWSLVRAILPVPLEVGSLTSQRNRPFSEDLLCPWCWTIFARSAQTGAVSSTEKIFPDAAQITTVYLLFTHVLKEQQAFSILIRLYRRAGCAGVMGEDHGQEGKTNSGIAHLRLQDAPWVSEVLCFLQQRHHLKSTILLTSSLHKISVIFSTRVRKAEGLSATRLLKPEDLHCFSRGLTSRTKGVICTRSNTMALRAPFATGSSPSNETFWLCLPTLLLGNPWVACSYSLYSRSHSPSPLSTSTLARGTPIPFCWGGEKKKKKHLQLP